MKLEGLRVVDLSLFLPGPHLSMMMADHGAEVIKVESIAGGDPARHMPHRQDGFAVWFRNTNRGKKSLALDLKKPEGRDLLLRLAQTADVFIEAFRPGVVDRLGVGYKDVAAVNPGIVYASISAFGQTGPYVAKPAHDIAVEAMTGLVGCNLGQDGKPAQPHMPVADMAASLMALSGILMALYRRQTTGRGDYLDIAMLDSQIAWTANSTGPVFAEGRAPRVKEERSWGGAAFYKIYETKDGRWVVLGGSEPKFAENLLTALGRPDLVPLCRLPPGPVQDPVKAFLAETFRTRTQAEWVEWFEGRDVCFAPVRDLKEGFDDPNLVARGMLLRDPRGNPHIGVPIKFADEPAEPRFDLPELGADSAEIVAALGLDPDRLIADGVIADPETAKAPAHG